MVTCFIRRPDGRVLVLRRSELVGTHKGKWSGVSGYIEASATPFATAYKELREEVGARFEQLRFVREAQMIMLDDPLTGKRWAVHPFLFDDLGVEVVLDWENVEHRWITPEELSGLDTVPGLREALDVALGLGGGAAP